MTDLDRAPSSIRDDSICESSLHPNKSSGDIVELKPCPFCKGFPKIVGLEADQEYGLIKCAGCDVTTDIMPSREELLSFWNTRTPDPESAAEIERLRRENADERSHRQRLQRALSFWMPSVSEDVEAETNGRAGSDAYLLMGYDGAVGQACWGDKVLIRALTAESAVERIKVQRNNALLDMERFMNIATECCDVIGLDHEQVDKLPLGLKSAVAAAWEEAAEWLAAQYPDNANTNAFCAALRSHVRSAQ